ncbi:hypothetical protein Taro_006680 [Colocasia esculenta]|uniref:Uncharacterized protein n=1 Tax=Colocasia esculenta TaxID=4460 RepID=A0A843TPC6_COLES|nr:hypothetical protein [Colocasia esculenta]
MKQGMLSQELKEALGMPDGAPPPWLINMQLTSKRVKLLDMYGSQVAIGIVTSTDPTKIVMGRPIGQDFCEVVVLLANKPDSPLFIKNHNRETMKDAIRSHILWFLEYVQLDFKRQVYLSGASS